MSINIEKVRSGDPQTIIYVINGFMSESSTDVEDWLDLLYYQYSSATVLHCQWQACNPKALVKTLSAGSLGLGGVSRYLLSANPYIRTGMAGYTAVTAAAGVYHFRKAMKNAERAGKHLAAHLDHHDTNVILVGHSLGARVIFHCLANLKTKNKVKIAKLFGGAVGKENDWGSILKAQPELKIYNYYSEKDYVLKALYPVGTFKADTPAGLTTLSHGVLNIDLTNSVSGHMEYKKASVGWRIVKQ